jgi:xylulokinase
MGVDLDVLDMNDMAPVGAALLAGVGTGIFRDPVEASEHIQRKLYKRIYSSDENHAVYDKRFAVYKELYPRLKDLYDQTQC